MDAAVLLDAVQAPPPCIAHICLPCPLLLDAGLSATAAQTRLERLECIRCERTFKNADVLRLHMRKKKHFAINPANRGWDRCAPGTQGGDGGGALPNSMPARAGVQSFVLLWDHRFWTVNYVEECTAAGEVPRAAPRL